MNSMTINLLAQSKTVVNAQSRVKSLGIGKRVTHYDYVFLTDCPYSNGEQILDRAVDNLEKHVNGDFSDICYVADVENQKWSLKFRTEAPLPADEFSINV